MPDQVFDKEAEMAVIAGCLQTDVARNAARKHIGREDFYSVACEELWVAMEEMDATGTPVDGVTLMSAVSGRRDPMETLTSIIGNVGAIVPTAANVEAYAETVRKWAVKRRLADLARGVLQRATHPDYDPYLLSTEAVSQFTDLRNTGLAGEAQSRLLVDLLAEADEEYDWAVPALLEKRDRLVLTGEEGLGKSYLGRQLGIFAAAGLHPFGLDHIRPVRVQILDHENSWKQIKRGSRRLYDFAAHYGEQDLGKRIHVVSLKRIDITSDRDLSMLHREVDVAKPDILVIGPLYRLTGKAIQTDDEAAPVLAALDTFRDRGCSLVLEAHAGHARDAGGDRDLRPRGSSALLGWPEFGYGMRRTKDDGIRMVRWRGDRDERGWPAYLRRAADRNASHYLPDPEAEVTA